MVNTGKIKVAVLMGGVSSERGVSLSTGKQVLEALGNDRYIAYGVDTALMPGARSHLERTSSEHIEAVEQAARQVTEHGLLGMQDILDPSGDYFPDVAFLALHGKFGEDGTIQGMLELAGITYTGSGVLASALAMDKSMAKKVLVSDGIKVPGSFEITSGCSCLDFDDPVSKADIFGYPLMVKPSRQGSTIGMCKVESSASLIDAVREAAAYDNKIIIEQFVSGTELTVGVLGNDNPIALPVVEIVPAKGFYDYEAKYTPGATEEIVPARIPGAQAECAQSIAISCHKSLGCRGVSRTDIILAEDGMYVLEVNTIPGLTPTSLLPRAAGAAGMSFSELLDIIIEAALEIDRRDTQEVC